MSQNARGSGSATPHTRLFSQPAAKVDVMESFLFCFVPFQTTKEKIKPEMTGKALHTCSVSVGHAAMETQGAQAALEARRRACEVTGVQQPLHRVVGPQRVHACSVAGARGPPTLHTWTAFHKSTSSSPTRGGSGPRRLSSLACFLLTKEKTNVKSRQCWYSPEPASSGSLLPAKLFT